MINMKFRQQVKLLLLLQIVVTVSSITVNLHLDRNSTTGLWYVKGDAGYYESEFAPLGKPPGLLDLQHRFLPSNYLNYSTFAIAKLMLTVQPLNKSCENELFEWFGNVVLDKDSSKIVSKSGLPKCIGGTLSVGGIISSWVNPKFNASTSKNFSSNPISIKCVVGGQSYCEDTKNTNAFKDHVQAPVKPAQFLNDWKDWKGHPNNNSEVILRMGVKNNPIVLLLDMIKIETLDSAAPFKANNSHTRGGSHVEWKPPNFNITEKSNVIITSHSQHPNTRKKFVNTVTSFRAIFKSGTIFKENIKPGTKVTAPTPRTGPSSATQVQLFVPSTPKSVFGLATSGSGISNRNNTKIQQMTTSSTTKVGWTVPVKPGNASLQLNKTNMNITVDRMNSKPVLSNRTYPVVQIFSALNTSTAKENGGWIAFPKPSIMPVNQSKTNTTVQGASPNRRPSSHYNLPAEGGRVVASGELNVTGLSNTTAKIHKKIKVKGSSEMVIFISPHLPPPIRNHSGHTNRRHKATVANKKLMLLCAAFLNIVAAGY